MACSGEVDFHQRKCRKAAWIRGLQRNLTADPPTHGGGVAFWRVGSGNPRPVEAPFHHFTVRRGTPDRADIPDRKVSISASANRIPPHSIPSSSRRVSSFSLLMLLIH